MEDRKQKTEDRRQESGVRNQGVLLMAYGSPNNLEEIEAYYTHIRGGRNPTPEQLENLKARYKAIGGNTPLLEITKNVAGKLGKLLNEQPHNSPTDNQYKVYIGMKHWHPYIEQTISEMVKDGIQNAIAIALAPHYSNLSVGSYVKAVQTAQDKLNSAIKFTFINSWADNPTFLEAISDKITDALNEFSNTEREQVMTLFTAHSLPSKILKENDPYQEQLLETSRKLAQLARLKQWRFAYQSAGKTGEEWLGPDITEAIEALAEEQHKYILVCPVGFITDHLEILYDVDIEAMETAKRNEVKLKRTESLNASQKLIEALASLVKSI
ncbi:MAG: ferrochelatase [Planctomycetes bacterium]|nr:ferrochelatase [Planctomycetota bacterium]